MFHLSKYFYTLLCHCFCKKKSFGSMQKINFSHSSVVKGFE